MEKSVLISLRVPAPLLNNLDDIASKVSYLNRSSVICNLLSNVLECTAPDDLPALYACPDCYGDGISVVIIRKDKVFRSKV